MSILSKVGGILGKITPGFLNPKKLLVKLAVSAIKSQLKGIVMSKKITMSLIAAVVSAVVAAILEWVNLHLIPIDAELRAKIVLAVLGLFGLGIVGHVATDIASMRAGLQKSRGSGGGAVR